MKLKIVVASIALCALAIPTLASANYVSYPTIHERAAEEDTTRFLHKTYPGWRYRQYGYVDCRNGRINRYTWVCRVGWLAGSKCRQGRARVTNEYREGNYVYYGISFRARRC